LEQKVAVFYLQHTGKGKAKYDRQGVVDHGRYILRQTARGAVETRHAPDEYGQVLGWLGRLYDESRSNARVIDTLIVNLPRELAAAEQVALLRAYLDHVTKTRAPYLFVIHTDKPDNPHAHIIIRDADVATGRRVAGLSKLGSSLRLRLLWETMCNAALRDHGVAISRHGKASEHHRRLNELADIQEGTVASPQCHQMPPALMSPEALKEGILNTPQKGPPVADVIEFDPTRLSKGVIDYNLPDIQSVLTTDAELTRLRGIRQQLTQLKADSRAAQTQLDSVIKRMGDLAETVTKLTAAHTSATQTYADYQRWGAFLRGFKIGHWKSATRIRAERARDNYKVATDVLDHTTRRLETVRKEHRVLMQFASKTERTEALIRGSDMTYGNDAELTDAEVILRNSLEMYAERVNEVHVMASLNKKDITADDANRLRRIISEQVQRDGYAH
jgi:hypothetical protein